LTLTQASIGVVILRQLVLELRRRVNWMISHGFSFRQG
jgi:hypothetical protein